MTHDETPNDDIQRKLTAARTQLIIEKPFLGALVLRLPLRAADASWCKTTATDARGIFYNPAYIDSLTLDQTKFILAHEALHCGLSHFHRREHRVRRRWDVACDFAVNGILVTDGLTPPPGALVQGAYSGMSAEEIYPNIKEQDGDQTLDQHVYDEGDPNDDARGQGSRGRASGATPPTASDAGSQTGDQTPNAANDPARNDTEPLAAPPPPLSPEERERLSTQWQLRLAGAAQQALRAGKLSAAIARMVDNLLQPRLPWRMLLARYMSANARTDYSFSRPNRREGAAILPGLRSASINVAVVVDTSGSIDPQEMQEFISEVNAIKGTLNARITLHACDAALAPEGPWIYEPWEEMQLPKTIKGGGGTRFAPAFEWAERQDQPPDVMLYFTDGEGEFPANEPRFPVLWLVKGRADVPWGQRIQLN